MRQLNGVYTRRFNQTHHRVGLVFQGGNKGILVEKETHLTELARDVVLNPVRAGMAPAPGDWPWSSHGATIGDEPRPDWSALSATVTGFGETESEAVEHYRRFVAQGENQPSPWARLRHLVFLVADVFADSLRRRLPALSDLCEVLQAKIRPVAGPLASLVTNT